MSPHEPHTPVDTQTSTNGAARVERVGASMIVSYDGTHNEDDAVALGRTFAQAGALISLAYVRHTSAGGLDREALAEHEAEELLLRGAALLGGGEAGRHVTTDRSTPDGLLRLADAVGAGTVVFCSDSHTAAGHVAIGNSARRMLEGGPLAVAIAPAGMAARGPRPLQLIALSGGLADGSARAAASSLAAATGATLTTLADESADLLVVGSRDGAAPGRVEISAAAENLIDEVARCPVLVLPAGVQLSFQHQPTITVRPGGAPVAA